LASTLNLANDDDDDDNDEDDKSDPNYDEEGTGRWSGERIRRRRGFGHSRYAGEHFAREGEGTHTERFLEAYLGLKAFRSCCFSSSVACKVSTNVPAEPKNRSPSKPSSRLSSSSRHVVWIVFIAHLFSGPSIVLPAIDVIASRPPMESVDLLSHSVRSIYTTTLCIRIMLSILLCVYSICLRLHSISVPNSSKRENDRRNVDQD
jgi:hypothetical protein